MGARGVATLLGIWSAGVAVGLLAGRAAVARAQDPYAAIERFARILALVESDYVEPVGVDVLVDAALEGLAGSLDEHTMWLSGEEMGAVTTPDGGVGTDVGLDVRGGIGAAVVTEVQGGSPAALEGLQPGDVLLAIDGQSTVGLGGDEIARRLAGARGEAVTLTLMREGWEAPREVRTVRDTVRHGAIAIESFPGERLYVRLDGFPEGVAAELRMALEARPSKGLVLDLRDNAGGLLEEAVGVADLFLDGGRIVSIELRGVPPEIFDARPGNVGSMPIVVLTNGGTASAAEVVAAALQERGRATVVGTRAWGKGSIQHLYRQRDGSGAALKLTVGHYRTPSGSLVPNREGREPDVVVPDGPTTDSRAELAARLAALDVAEAERAALIDLLTRIDDEPLVATVAWEQAASRRVDPPLAEALRRLGGDPR
jgi:carboxyl-terminal processing protease